jgi:periplasmic copper chaperone A
MNKAILRSTVFAIITLAGAMISTSASAHITPKPQKVALGETTDVAFTIGHGCSGSATTSVALKFPSSVKATANPLKGWTATSAKGVITYVATSPLPDKTKATFSLKVTFPNASQLTYFPIVQTCEKGALKWVSKDHDSDNPAPVVMVGTAKLPKHS